MPPDGERSTFGLRRAQTDELWEILPGARVGNPRGSAWRKTCSSSAIGETTRRDQMTTDKIARNMEVIGADGVHLGTVDGVANGRIRLAKRDSGEGSHKGHAHFI